MDQNNDRMSIILEEYAKFFRQRKKFKSSKYYPVFDAIALDHKNLWGINHKMYIIPDDYDFIVPKTHKDEYPIILSAIKAWTETNTCINKKVYMDEAAMIYVADDHKYCFKEEDLPNLKRFQINPYSGRPLSREFVEKIAPGREYIGPTITSRCTQCPSDEECTVDRYLSPDSSEWIRKWRRGIEMGGMSAIKISEDTISELAEYKRCNPIRVHRGIGINDNNIKDIEPFLPLTEGKQITFTEVRPRSWTTDRNVAEGFARPNSISKALLRGFVVEMIIEPKDILVDTNLLQITDQFNSQDEVVVLPGTYQGIVSKVYYRPPEYIRIGKQYY